MIPYQPPSFLDDCTILSKIIDGKKTWRSVDGKRLYQWDSQHGEIEVYNNRGRHLGVVDKNNNYLKPAVSGRRINV